MVRLFRRRGRPFYPQRPNFDVAIASMIFEFGSPRKLDANNILE
jgi:hypothetical protein